MRLLFVGPPGAGKGTQAERVAHKLGLAHVSTGDMFRALDTTTELGRRVKVIMDSGGYVSDEIVVEMLAERIAQPDASDGFILDGFPRTAGQVEALDSLLGTEGLDRVIVFDVDPDEIVKRMLSRGRADDNEDTIRARLAIYRDQTEPLIALYESRGGVRHVDAVGEIDEITDRVLAALDR